MQCAFNASSGANVSCELAESDFVGLVIETAARMECSGPALYMGRTLSYARPEPPLVLILSHSLI